jgi:hypothetical protein
MYEFLFKACIFLIYIKISYDFTIYFYYLNLFCIFCVWFNTTFNLKFFRSIH